MFLNWLVYFIAIACFFVISNSAERLFSKKNKKNEAVVAKKNNIKEQFKMIQATNRDGAAGANFIVRILYVCLIMTVMLNLRWMNVIDAGLLVGLIGVVLVVLVTKEKVYNVIFTASVVMVIMIVMMVMPLSVFGWFVPWYLLLLSTIIYVFFLDKIQKIAGLYI